MKAILKFDFQKRKQLHFSEDNYLNYTKKTQFACEFYIFPKTRRNKNNQWTHLGALKKFQNSKLGLVELPASFRHR